MKFGDFLFPESRTPGTDYKVVNEALAEAELADRLGFHSVWLGEHHFDGVCTYAEDRRACRYSCCYANGDAHSYADGYAYAEGYTNSLRYHYASYDPETSTRSYDQVSHRQYSKHSQRAYGASWCSQHTYARSCKFPKRDCNSSCSLESARGDSRSAGGFLYKLQRPLCRNK